MKKTLCALLFLITATVFAQSLSFPLETTLPLQFNTGNPAPYGLPSTTITIEGKTLPVILDTGAKKEELALSKHAIKNLHVTFTGKQVCSMAFDGKSCLPEFIIPEVKIGSFVVHNVHGTLMSKLWGGHMKGFQATEASQNGVIGFALLSKFNLLLDYAHEKAILIKPHYNPSQYDITQWTSLPFQGHLLTQLKINNKTVTLSWDTGAVPSGIIKRSLARNFIQSTCANNSPYTDKTCRGVATHSFTTLNDGKLPNTWFMVTDIPAFAPFDGLVGSNFYHANLVYFNFDQQRIYVTTATN